MADESIIKPPSIANRKPMSRGTIGAIFVVIVAVGLMGIGVSSYLSAGRPSAAVEPAEAVPAKRAGRPMDIDQEIKAEAERVVAPPPAPVVPQADPALLRPTPLPMARSALTSPPDDEAKAGAERDALSNTSAVFAFDVSTSARGQEAASPTSAIDAQLDKLRADMAIAAAGGAASTTGTTPSVPGAVARSVNSANGAWQAALAGEPRVATIRPGARQSRLILAQGKVIPAVIGRRLNSDLPGEISAQVSMDVYDSFEGFTRVIPKGSWLVGRYSADVSAGQSRMMVAFKRLVLPDGRSFDLPAADGMDGSGQAGISGDVDNHFLRMFGNSLLIALLADRLERGAGSGSTSLVSTSGARTAAGEVLVDTSKTVLERNKTIPPTITVPIGARINVQVAGDLEFPESMRGTTK